MLHSQRQNVFARAFVQLVLLMPIAGTFCLDHTLICINRQRGIKSFILVCDSALQSDRSCRITD
jgi:hypothetical protein